MNPCKCLTPPFFFDDYETLELGEDLHGADISLLTCKQCGLVWLKYLVEEPQYSDSGRWWRVSVPTEQQGMITVANARDFIEQQQEGFVGGSFFKSTGIKSFAPISVC